MATNPLLRYGPPRQINCTLGVSGEFPNYTSGSAYSGTVSINGAQGATRVELVPPGTDASGTAYVPLVNADFAAAGASWSVVNQLSAGTFTFQAGAGRTAAGFLRWAPTASAPNSYFGDTIANTTLVQSIGGEVNLEAWVRCTAIGPQPNGEILDILLGVQIFEDAAGTIVRDQFTIGGSASGSRRISGVIDWFPLRTRVNIPAGTYYRLAFQCRAGTSGTVEFDDCEWDARGVPSAPPAALALPAGFTIDTVTSPDRVRVQWPAVPVASQPIRAVTGSIKNSTSNYTIAVPSGYGVGDLVLVVFVQRSDQSTDAGRIVGWPNLGSDRVHLHGFGGGLNPGVGGTSYVIRMNAAMAGGIQVNPEGAGNVDNAAVCVFMPGSFWSGSLVALQSFAFSADPPVLDSSAWTGGDKALFATIWWGNGDAVVNTPYPFPSTAATEVRTGTSNLDCATGLCFDVISPGSNNPAAFSGSNIDGAGCIAIRLNSTANNTPTPSTSTLPNLGFETGDVNWLKGAGWAITNAAPVDAGSWSAKYTGLGQSSLVHETMAPVTPGTSITASCRVSKGNNRKDFAGGAVLLEWLDANTRPLGFNVGNVINTGSSAFQTSTVTATAPAGSAYVRLGASGTRDVKGRASDAVTVDAFAWNHTFALGGSGGSGGTVTPTTGPIALSFRVTDSVGCSAVATRTINQA